MEDSKLVELEFPTRRSFSSIAPAATEGRKATMQALKVVAATTSSFLSRHPLSSFLSSFVCCVVMCVPE
jgi:hypothetical protein